MPFFSIIIPVYKVEEYLERCVNSILRQKCSDFEIILINDGSPDSSPAICDRLVASNQKIKVIHKINGGSSSARNAGINMAQGEYLIFVDSDDYWVGTKSLNNIYKRLKDNNRTEVLFYGHKVLNLTNNSLLSVKTGYDRQFIFNKNKDEVIEYLFNNNLFPGAAWVTAVSRNIVITNEIYFQEGLIAEDVDWLLKLFNFTKNFDSVEDIFYVYIKNRLDSISNSSGKKGVESILFILDKWVPYFQQHDERKITNYFLEFLAFHYSTVFLTFAYLNDSDKVVLKPRLKKYFFLFNYTKSFKQSIIKYLLSLLGFSRGSIVARKLYILLNKN